MQAMFDRFGSQKQNLIDDLADKRQALEGMTQAEGLENIQTLMAEFLRRVKDRNSHEKRPFITRIIERVTVWADPTMKLKVFLEPPSRLAAPKNNLRKQMLDNTLNGGSDGTRTHDLRRDRATL